MVIVAAGPWVKQVWDMLELPAAISVKGRDGKVHDGVAMWTFWSLQEGTLGVDHKLQRTHQTGRGGEAGQHGPAAQRERRRHDAIGRQRAALEVGHDSLGPVTGKLERVAVTVCHSDGLAYWRTGSSLIQILQYVRPSHN